MTRAKNQNNQFTSITIEDDDPLSIMNHSSSLLEDDNKSSFLMDDDENFLTNGVLGEEELIALSSPESSQEAHTPATPPHELYNILQNITTQPPQTHRYVQSTDNIPPFGVVDLHGTMFAPPMMMPQTTNFYQPQMECFPQMMAPAQDFSAYFTPQARVVQPPQMPNIKSELVTTPSPKASEKYDSDDSYEGRGDEPPKKRRKRKNEEIDEDNDRLNELCTKPNAQLTEEEKQEKRRLRNRQTAQRSRNNQKVRLDSLERENNDLKKKNTKLTRQLEESQKQCDLLKKENQMLKQEKLRKNVIIDVPSVPIPVSQHMRNPGKVTMLMAIVFCVGCTFFIGNMLGEKDLVRSNYRSVTVPESVAVKTAAVTNRAIIPENQEHKNVGGRNLLHLKNDTGYCGVGEGMCYDKQKAHNEVDEDGTMELPTQEISFDFDGSGMVKKNVYYPSKMKRHFGLHEHQQQSTPASEKSQAASAQPVSGDVIVPAAAKESNSLTIDHNNKQLMRLTEDSFYEKLREKKHKYAMGSIYEFPSPVEETSEDGKKTIHMFCPFIYPMLPSESDRDDSFAGLSGGLDEDTRIKIHVPVQLLNKTTNNKIVRLAEITGENMSLSESYFELDAALAPVGAEPINREHK